MADFAQLKQEYQPAPDTIEKEGAQLNDIKLGWRATVPQSHGGPRSQQERIWDAIKSVDTVFVDLKHGIEVSPGQQLCRLENNEEDATWRQCRHLGEWRANQPD